MRNYELDNNGVVVLANSDGWRSAYDFANDLEARFPDQEAGDFAYCCEYNGTEIAEGDKIVDLVCVKLGERDKDSWIWYVCVLPAGKEGRYNQVDWIVRGWCDYTGWDCQSDSNWTRV